MEVIISGSPINGFKVHGPFIDSDTAANWAWVQNNLDRWWVAPLEECLSVEEESGVTSGRSAEGNNSDWSSYKEYLTKTIRKILED